MESESDHRDDESVASEPEVEEKPEVEETKPKSALKKTREVLPPVERPQLPYVGLLLGVFCWP